MTPYGFLIFTLAFVPAVAAAYVWWHVTHSGEDLSKYCAVRSASIED